MMMHKGASAWSDSMSGDKDDVNKDKDDVDNTDDNKEDDDDYDGDGDDDDDDAQGGERVQGVTVCQGTKAAVNSLSLLTMR